MAAAIYEIGAGTSAPMPIAANATPANHDGKCWSKSSGTTVLLSTEPGFAPGSGFTPAEIAI